MMKIVSTEIGGPTPTPEVPVCPCGSHSWKARQWADCSRIVKVAVIFGRFQGGIESWEEEGDSDGEGNGGNFRQEEWVCVVCGQAAPGDMIEAIDAAFEQIA